jgi:hypothetical protein
MDKFWHTDTIFEVVARNYPYDPYASNNVWYMNGDSFIVVDQHGKRCVDESLPYSLRAKYYRRPDKLLTFLVFDKRCYRRSGGVFRYLGAGVPNDLWFGLLESSWLIHGRDSKELGQRISERLERYRDVADVKLDGGFASALDATIERYNGFAQKGVDDDFGRGSNLGTAAWLLGRVRDNHFPNKHMHPMDASQGLFAIVMAPTCFSTKGGLVVDRFARVVGQNGAPIDGLYAAGNCTASPSNEGYVLSTIGPAMTQGYLAASHAAGALRNADGH